MSTLTLNDVTKAHEIFSHIYKAFQQRVTLFNFKLKRSPEMRVLKSVRNYESALNALSKNEMFRELWNEFTCIELGGKLRENALENKEFISHCEHLLNGSHKVFQFAKPLANNLSVDDIKLIKVVAEKIVDEIIQWKQQAAKKNRTDTWQFDFCVADIHSVIEKCQALMQFNKTVRAVIVEPTLLIEWWELVERQHAIAKQAHQKSFY